MKPWAPGLPIPLEWDLEIPEPHTVRLRLRSDPGQLTINGMMQVSINNGSALPIGMTVNIDIIDLVYAVLVHVGEDISVPWYDPAIRTPQGAFVAGATLAAISPVDGEAWTAHAPNINQIDVTVANSTTPWLVTVLSQWSTVSSGFQPTSYTSAGGVISFMFPMDISGETAFNQSGVITNNIDLQGNRAKLSTEPL